MNSRIFGVLSLSVLLAGAFARAAWAVPAQFTVQGALRDNTGHLQSMPVTASVSLFDAPTGGNRIAGPYAFTAVPVTNGLFTLQIEDSEISTKIGKGAVFLELTINADVYSRFAVTAQLFAVRAGLAESTEALRGQPLAAAAPTEGQILQFTGGAWTAVTPTAPGAPTPAPAPSVPSGAVMAFDLERCPAGWAPFAPAAGRTIIGVNDGGNGLAPRARGDVVGEEAHRLTADELAPHTHAGNTGRGKQMSYRLVSGSGTETIGNHGTGFAGGTAFFDRDDADYPFSNHFHDFVTDSGAVGGKPHNVMQPSLALLYCRKM